MTDDKFKKLIKEKLQEKQLDYDRRFLPVIKYDELEPEMVGIRPRLQGPRDGFRDFVIRDEGDKGLPGLINLIGIESPGLTASPSIARYAKDMVTEALD